MSEEMKNVQKLTDEELEQVTGGTESLNQLYRQLTLENQAILEKEFTGKIEETIKLNQKMKNEGVGNPDDCGKIMKNMIIFQDGMQVLNDFTSKR